MSMYVNAVKSSDSAFQRKTTVKESALKGALIGAGAGGAGTIITGLSLTPKVLTKDTFIKNSIKTFERLADNVPKEQFDEAVKEVAQQAETLYEPYRDLAQNAAKTFRRNIPKAALIGTAAACAIGAGIATIIHHNKNKEVPKTK